MIDKFPIIFTTEEISFYMFGEKEANLVQTMLCQMTPCIGGL